MGSEQLQIMLRKYMYFLIMIITITLVSSCANNEFDSCVKFYEDKAKREKSDGKQQGLTWRELADHYIFYACKVR